MKEKKYIGLLSAFLTVDGEVNCWGQGGWSVFIRTAGCGVGCVWCDTKYSWHPGGGEPLLPWQVVELVDRVSRGTKKVTITGGEPLEQDHEALAMLICLLADKKYKITMETSGTQNTLEFRMNFSHIFPEKLGDLSFIVDYKLAASRFKGTMDIDNHFALLPRGDVVKFVIDDEQDFAEAVDVANMLDRSANFKARMFFAPSHGKMKPAKLFEMMLKAEMPRKNVGINMQMHKYIWEDDTRAEEDLSGIDFTKRTLGREQFLQNVRRGK